ncbi:hypothetical protein TRFO_23415 [Tritrichomonas foetus]|uniref:RRM Nup35-type domain-containing protein n=1 Tax=Tritrichomonas foetus TaxID=1144522 RepID=A0A1J4KEI4_9EUKA|nr:hypothetical protein TRFO_23415 [Tritrichomonas foetus]|eukprot:OHT08140.1 hypothetical protein TRFO_23415 [Tritrichomonas foetus]
MSEKEQQYLNSRLFGSKNATRVTKSQQNKSIVTPRTEEETFQFDSFASDKPSGSVYDRTNEFGVTQHEKTHDIGTWITVIGTIHGYTNEIVQHFSKYGTILRVDDTAGNWLYIEYPSTDIAELAVKSCGRSPQLITNTMAVSVVPGRLKSSYVMEKASPPSTVEFDPICEGVAVPEERRNIVGAIFESVFG